MHLGSTWAEQEDPNTWEICIQELHWFVSVYGENEGSEEVFTTLKKSGREVWESLEVFWIGKHIITD